MKGFLVSSIGSNSGKTLITVGLANALANNGLSCQVIKSGPDFIDPKFHEQTTNKPCYNIDLWAMRKTLRSSIYNRIKAEILIAEGAMGLFDGAINGQGSSADLAYELDLPIILVINASKIGQSISAIIEGFINHRKNLKFAGVIFNQVNTKRHKHIIKEATNHLNLGFRAYLPTNHDIKIESRHLGLIQAFEISKLNNIINQITNMISENLNLDKLIGSLDKLKLPETPPLKTTHIFSRFIENKNITILKDLAFSFHYQHIIDELVERAAKVEYISVLHDDAISNDTDLLYLPGGYPEIYASQIASSNNFFTSLRNHCKNKKSIFAECGGYMILGNNIIDNDQVSHKMAGLLNITTSFTKPKLHLGYRNAKLCNNQLFDRDNNEGNKDNFGALLKGHEFHYSNISYTKSYAKFAEFSDALYQPIKESGVSHGNIFASYFHLIDRK